MRRYLQSDMFKFSFTEMYSHPVAEFEPGNGYIKVQRLSRKTLRTYEISWPPERRHEKIKKQTNTD